MLKKVSIGVSAVVALLLIGAIVAPSFMNWTSYIPEISNQVKRITGRDLAIDGALEVRILPSPMVLAKEIKLGNAPTGSVPYMVVLDAVEVRVALMPLLSGDVQVERVNLVNPVITLEKFADGRTNLEMEPSAPPQPSTTPAPTATPTATPAQKSSTPDLGLRLDHFSLSNATVVYIDHQNGQTERIENLDATLKASSMQGPFDAKGQVRLRGVPLGFELNVGKIIAGRSVSINTTLQAPAETRVSAVGSVTDLDAIPRFKGKVQISGENLAKTVNAISQSNVAPPVLAHSFDVHTTVDISTPSVSLTDVEIEFSKSRLMGQVHVDLANAPVFSVQLKANHLDVDSLLKAANAQPLLRAVKESSKSIAPPPPSTPKANAAKSGFAFPTDLSGTVEVVVEALSLKGDLVRDMRLSAELADGELTLSQFQLQAPGVTDLALFGFVETNDGLPSFSGDLEVLSSDPKGFADWLGASIPPQVASRLKQVSLKTQVNANPDQVAFSNLKLTGDRSTVVGGVTVALRKRPSLGVSLSLDALNLDNYANPNGPAAAAASNGAASTSALSTGPAPQPDKSSPMDALKAWAALEALNDFDANMNVQVGALTHQGQTYKDLKLDGTLYAGTMTLRNLSLGRFNTATAKISGAFNGFGGIPEMSGVKVQGSVKKVPVLARALGLDDLPKKLQTVKLNVTADGSLLKPRFDAKVNAFAGEFGLRGSFSVLPLNFGYGGTFTARHPDMVRLLTDLDIGIVPSGPLGPLDISAALKSDGVTHTVTNLRGHVGDMDIAGKVEARMGADKPTFTANLKTGLIPVSAFLPAEPSQKNSKTSSTGSSQTKATSAAKSNEPQWSSEPLGLDVLNSVDGQFTLLAKAIKYQNYVLKDADISARLNDGILTTDRVKGVLFGGPIDVRAVVRADGNPTLATNLTVQTLDLSQAMKAVSGKDFGGGALNLNMDMNAVGLNPMALVSSLGGRADVDVGGLDVSGASDGSPLAAMFGLVSALGQLGGSSSPNKGLADVGMQMNVQNGVADVSNFNINSALGTGKGTGNVNLVAWTIDFSGDMTMEANVLTSLLSKGRIGTQIVPFSLSGALDKPDVNVALLPLGGAAGNPVGNLLENVLPGLLQGQFKLPSSPAPAPAPAPAPTDGTLAPPPSQSGSGSSGGNNGQLSPEEIIKKLLGG